ncbi:hypothetical protein KIN20_008018 [Parelaphostrongylus tenuis]|uniref:Protein transport protein SEC23 n=1 Tax=Parelaphostrongylus tenuis TaxID=148309 RepID=A0AAD5M462_PARTN|nr:hypothetical protein KIN20_008018 [Parelaphostrongylus tenuis]
MAALRLVGKRLLDVACLSTLILRRLAPSVNTGRPSIQLLGEMATWDEYLASQQAVDGVQFTWNLWPHSRVDAQKLIVPLACFYTPLKERPADQPQQPALEYDPVLCQKATCKAILNPLCFVDYRAKSWVCPFCNQRNPFPAHYAAIAEDNRPPELYPQFTTIEYTLKKATTMPPIFMFVVDTCITSEETQSLEGKLTDSAFSSSC